MGNPQVTVESNDGTRQAEVDDLGGLYVGNEQRLRADNAASYFCSYRWTGVVDGSSIQMHIKVSSDTEILDAVELIEVEGKVHRDLYEGTTFVDETNGDGAGEGEELSLYNANRSFTDNDGTGGDAGWQVYYNPNVNSKGTNIDTGLIGAAGKFSLSGGKDQSDAYWLLDSDSYLVEVTNQSGSSIDVVVAVLGHTHTTVC